MQTIVIVGFGLVALALIIISRQLERIEFLLQRLVNDNDPHRFPPSN